MLLSILRNGPLVVSGIVFGIACSVLTSMFYKNSVDCSLPFVYTLPAFFTLFAFIFWLLLSPASLKDEDNNKPKIGMFVVWVTFFSSTAVALGMTFFRYCKKGDCYSTTPLTSLVFFTVLLPLSGSILWWHRRDDDDSDDDW